MPFIRRPYVRPAHYITVPKSGKRPFPVGPMTFFTLFMFVVRKRSITIKKENSIGLYLFAQILDFHEKQKVPFHVSLSENCCPCRLHEATWSDAHYTQADVLSSPFSIYSITLSFFFDVI